MHRIVLKKKRISGKKSNQGENITKADENQHSRTLNIHMKHVHLNCPVYFELRKEILNKSSVIKKKKNNYSNIRGAFLCYRR